MYVCITCVRKETPRTADVTKIAGYVRVRDFFRIFGVHIFQVMASLVNLV